MEEKAKAKKPFYKRWWVWAIVIVLVIGMFAPSDDTETKDNDSKPLSKRSPQQLNQPTPSRKMRSRLSSLLHRLKSRKNPPTP